MTRMWRALRNGLHLRQRLLAAMGLALALAWLLPASLDWSVRAGLVWCSGGIVYLTLAFGLMSRCDISHIRRAAAVEDEARLVFFTLVLFAVLSSFYAVFVLIADAKALAGIAKATYVGLAALIVLVSWLVLQVVFTLHYAHAYYGEAAEGGIHKGLVFPGEDEPDYWDFFYFTTSLGAASQTSDVAITSRAIRRFAAFQAVLSFVFNTTVVALAINLASGLI